MFSPKSLPRRSGGKAKGKPRRTRSNPQTQEDLRDGPLTCANFSDIFFKMSRKRYDVVEYAIPSQPTLEELYAKRDAGLRLFGWEKRLIWIITTRRTLWTRQKVCRYCHCDLDEDKATLDHIYPRSKGGGDTEANVVLTCATCNSRKGNMTVIEFRKTPYYLWIKGMLKDLPVKPPSKWKVRLEKRKEASATNYLNFQILMFCHAPLC